MKKPSVLFFDLDDTLVDSDSAYEIGMKTIGISSKDETYLKARAQVKAELPHLAPVARSRVLYFKKYLEFRNEYSPQKHMDLVYNYEKSVLENIQHQWLQLKRDALFSELKKICPKNFIITNETVRVQMAKLKVMDPHFKYFDGLITSEEVGVEKPNPLIYQRALKKMNAQPAQCLMIGDNFENDIAAALSLGINAIHSLEFKASTQIGAPSIKKLDELISILSD